MLNKKNLVILEGGLTRDPEEFESAGVVHLSVAVDNAGTEKGVQYASGYFDVKVWLNNSKYSAPALAEGVRAALKEGTLKKGTRVSVIGTLKQERWEKEGQKSSKVVVVAESVEIYTARPANTNATQQNTGNTAYATATSDQEDEVTFVPNF